MMHDDGWAHLITSLGMVKGPSAAKRIIGAVCPEHNVKVEATGWCWLVHDRQAASDTSGACVPNDSMGPIVSGTTCLCVRHGCT